MKIKTHWTYQNNMKGKPSFLGFFGSSLTQAEIAVCSRRLFKLVYERLSNAMSVILFLNVF